MRMISKFALTATLALGTSLGFIEIKPVGADIGEGDCQALNALNIVSQTVKRSALSVDTQVSSLISPVYDNFEPEPTEPPTGTGGTGSR